MRNSFIVVTLLLAVARTVMLADDCDCKIVPFKPDPPCFQVCVSNILASASYSELTGKYGLSDDISRKIIKAREKGIDTSSGWYKKALSDSDIFHVDAKFNSLRQDDKYK